MNESPQSNTIYDVEIFTSEQKAVIDQNRLRALKRKSEFDARNISVNTAKSPKFDELTCPFIDPDTMTECGSKDIFIDYQRDFDEIICQRCKFKSTDYSLINKVEAAKQYLLSEDVLRGMNSCSKANPRNSSFAPMKLYLLKHVRRNSFERWGDEEGLLAERDKREKVKFDRYEESCADVLDNFSSSTSTSECNTEGKKVLPAVGKLNKNSKLKVITSGGILNGKDIVDYYSNGADFVLINGT